MPGLENESAAQTGRELSAERVALLCETAELIGGDWSGDMFDGREIRNWIYTALDDSLASVNDAREAIKRIRAEY